MDLCDQCGNKSLMPEHYSDVCLCKKCSMKLLSSTWKNKEYDSNEEIDRQMEKVIKLAGKYSYSPKVIEGLSSFFSSKKIDGLYRKFSGGCGQKIIVCSDRLIIKTEADFDIKEIRKAYKRMCAGKRGAIGIGDYVSAQQATQIVSMAIGNIVPGRGFIKSGIKALGSGVASNAISGNVSYNEKPQKSETLNISSGDKKIYYAEYDIVTFYGPISEEEYGFIRFQNSHLADESNMDVIFCFVNTKSKVNQANEIYNYIQSQIASINESKLNNVMEQPQMTEKNEAIQNMWKNKSVSDLYEPGSTFKVITSSIAIEENITSPDNEGEFVCTGYEHVADRNIACWRYYNPHGYQSLRKALENSCNPAFIQLSRKIGIPTTYKYYRAFGLFEKTGVALAGEENSIVRAEKNATAVDLATMSFGQRLSITPLQMITAISAVANDGYLMQPRIVKEITNTDTGAVTEVEPVTVRQVISKETSEKVRGMMESVVVYGTGKHGAVSGYSIGGKTGTSEPPDDKKEQGYVASYVAISPVEDTQVVLLLTLYKPPQSNHQGGQVAGPVVSQMLSEILPYLNVPSESTKTDNSNNENLITVPNIKDKTIAEAQKTLEDAGFKVKVTCSSDVNTELVSEQNPKPGIALSKSSVIMLYSKDAVATSTTVPDLKGMGASEATRVLKEKNLNISIEGSGTVISQDYSKDTKVPEGTVITVTLKQTLTDAH